MGWAPPGGGAHRGEGFRGPWPRPGWGSCRRLHQERPPVCLVRGCRPPPPVGKGLEQAEEVRATARP